MSLRLNSRCISRRHHNAVSVRPPDCYGCIHHVASPADCGPGDFSLRHHPEGNVKVRRRRLRDSDAVSDAAVGGHVLVVAQRRFLAAHPRHRGIVVCWRCGSDAGSGQGGAQSPQQEGQGCCDLHWIEGGAGKTRRWGRRHGSGSKWQTGRPQPSRTGSSRSCRFQHLRTSEEGMASSSRERKRKVRKRFWRICEVKSGVDNIRDISVTRAGGGQYCGSGQMISFILPQAEANSFAEIFSRISYLRALGRFLGRSTIYYLGGPGWRLKSVTSLLDCDVCQTSQCHIKLI